MLDVDGWLTQGPGCFTPGYETVPVAQQARWAPNPVWTGMENLAPHGDSIPGMFPIASLYTDYAIPAHLVPLNINFKNWTVPQYNLRVTNLYSNPRILRDFRNFGNRKRPDNDQLGRNM